MPRSGKVASPAGAVTPGLVPQPVHHPHGRREETSVSSLGMGDRTRSPLGWHHPEPCAMCRVVAGGSLWWGGRAGVPALRGV